MYKPFKYILVDANGQRTRGNHRARATTIPSVPTEDGGRNGRIDMDLIIGAFKWLFQTRTGVISLLVGGIVLFFIISAVLEVRTRARYKNHEKSPDDWDLFDDESGWSDFEDDNH